MSEDERTRGRSSFAILISEIGLVLFLYAGGAVCMSCGYASAKFQYAHKGRILDGVREIQKYYETHGELPQHLEEAIPQDYSPEDSIGWLRYRRETADRYVVWLRKSDIAAGLRGVNRPPAENERPLPGDVYGEFDVGGHEVASSWR